MPYYDFRCENPDCHYIFDESFPMGILPVVFCPLCSTVAIRVFSPPRMNGLSKGPGSSITHFNRLDTLKEVKQEARTAELNGDFIKNPSSQKHYAGRIAELENVPEAARKIDYDKEGHPLDN